MIYADCLTSYSAEDIQILKDNFKPIEHEVWIDRDKDIKKIYNTFVYAVTEKVYFKLAKRYVLPGTSGWSKNDNKRAAEAGIGLNEYLTVEGIKQFPYFEYEKEYIHSICRQSIELCDYCSARDLALVSKRLKEYLLKHEAPALDKEYAGELQRLELLSSIASKYNSDFMILT